MMMRRRKGGGERATKGKSQATCTRQQPPTSEELIINLLSPSPNAALTRPPSLHFHLRFSLSFTYHPLSRHPLHSHLSFLPRLFPFPFIQSFPPFSLFPRLLPSLSSPSPTLRRVVCLRLRLLALSLSPLSLHGLAFDLAPVLSTSKPCRYFWSI